MVPNGQKAICYGTKRYGNALPRKTVCLSQITYIDTQYSTLQLPGVAVIYVMLFMLINSVNTVTLTLTKGGEAAEKNMLNITYG